MGSLLGFDGHTTVLYADFHETTRDCGIVNVMNWVERRVQAAPSITSLWPARAFVAVHRGALRASRRLELFQRHQSGTVAANNIMYNAENINTPSHFADFTLFQARLRHRCYPGALQ